MAGVWERLVGVTKSLILSTLASNYFRKISGEELRTFFKEVQCILNWRPLTPVSSDIHEYRTISSMSIMHMGVVPPAPSGRFRKAEGLSKSWKTCQLLAQEFWHSWVKFYLPTLVPCQKWHLDIKNFKVGDLVLLKTTNLGKNQWDRARISDIFPGRDGKVRCIELRKPDGSLWLRSHRSICKLECEVY